MLGRILAATALGALSVSAAGASQVDITNDSGTIDDQFLSSTGGLDSDQFTGDIANGVSVWLRARNNRFNPAGGGDNPTVSPGSVSTNSSATYTLNAPADPNKDGFSFEFQFSPRDGDTVADSNYFLELALDKDPAANTNFESDNIFSGVIFDDDDNDGNKLREDGTPDRNVVDSGEVDELLDSGRFGSTAVSAVNRSWDDGDSVLIDGVSKRGDPNAVDVIFNNPTGDRITDNLPEYVVANSWRAGWDFPDFSLLGDDLGAPSNGLFDLRLTAFEFAGGQIGNQLAQVQVTADIAPVPVPAALPLLLAGLGGLGLVARRKRKAA